MITSRQKKINFYFAFRMFLIKAITPQMVPSIIITKFREILRLSSRLVEILEASITKVRKSVFEDNGRSLK
jgi:hypothetical protein